MKNRPLISESKPAPVSGEPLVSALVICYNHSRFLNECLESIRNQTYKNLELIIVDDCSRDNSAALIRDWLKQCPFPWHFVEHKENKGICRSLNDALDQAKGDFISMVAADDLWLPEKIEHQVQLLKREPEKVGVLYSDVYQVNEHGDFLPEMTFIGSHVSIWPPPSGDILELLWHHGNWIPAMGSLIRRRCYAAVGQYDENLWYEDYDMWLRMAEQFEFKFSDRVSAKYRVLSTSMVRSSWPKICQAAVQICVKNLQRKGLVPKIRSLIKAQLIIWAKRCYSSGSPNYKRSMLAASIRAPRPSLVVPTILALAGVSFQQYQRLQKAVRFGQSPPKTKKPQPAEVENTVS